MLRFAPRSKSRNNSNGKIRSKMKNSANELYIRAFKAQRDNPSSLHPSVYRLSQRTAYNVASLKRPLNRSAPVIYICTRARQTARIVN